MMQVLNPKRCLQFFMYLSEIPQDGCFAKVACLDLVLIFQFMKKSLFSKYSYEIVQGMQISNAVKMCLENHDNPFLANFPFLLLLPNF